MQNSLPLNFPSRETFCCRHVLALLTCVLAGALLNPGYGVRAEELNTEKARKYVKNILENKKQFENVQFDETPGNRMIKYVTQEKEQSGIRLVTLTKVEGSYKERTFEVKQPSYGAKWFNYDSASADSAGSFHNPSLSESNVQKIRPGACFPGAGSAAGKRQPGCRQT